ncbi:hypothetical protein ACIQMV_08620 [Streptomyces sp. NPDC091412]|uniref:hypothetical protein n=1 Tax=Streptomyces sp. NPDC091412 TaxID=3366002 RepID=UPI0037F7A437
MTDIASTPSSLAMILCWLLAALTLTAVTLIAGLLGMAVFKTSDRAGVAACLRAIAEIIRALRSR